MLLLGADTVFRDGSLLNKVHTDPLTKAATKAGVPVIVACEVLKLAPDDPVEPDEDRVDLDAASTDQTRHVTEGGPDALDQIGVLVHHTAAPFFAQGYDFSRVLRPPPGRAVGA